MLFSVIDEEQCPDCQTTLDAFTEIAKAAFSVLPPELGIFVKVSIPSIYFF